MRAFKLRNESVISSARPFQPPLSAVVLAIAAICLAVAGADNEVVLLLAGFALLVAALRS